MHAVDKLCRLFECQVGDLFEWYPTKPLPLKLKLPHNDPEVTRLSRVTHKKKNRGSSVAQQLITHGKRVLCRDAEWLVTKVHAEKPFKRFAALAQTISSGGIMKPHS